MKHFQLIPHFVFIFICFISLDIVKADEITVGNVKYSQIENTDNYKNISDPGKPDEKFQNIDKNNTEIYQRMINQDYIENCRFEKFDWNELIKLNKNNSDITFKFKKCYFNEITGIDSIKETINIFNLDIRNCGFADDLNFRNLKVTRNALVQNSNLKSLGFAYCHFDSSLTIRYMKEFDFFFSNTNVHGNFNLVNIVINSSRFENVIINSYFKLSGLIFLKPADSFEEFYTYAGTDLNNSKFNKEFSFGGAFVGDNFTINRIKIIEGINDTSSVLSPEKITNFKFLHNVIFNNKCKFYFSNDFYVSNYKIDLEELEKIEFIVDPEPGSEYANNKFYYDIISYVNTSNNATKDLKEEIIDKYKWKVFEQETKLNFENSSKSNISLKLRTLSLIKYGWGYFTFLMSSDEFGFIKFLISTFILLIIFNFIYYVFYNIEIGILINCSSLPDRYSYVRELNKVLFSTGVIAQLKDKRVMFSKVPLNVFKRTSKVRFSEICLFNLNVFFNPKYKKEYLHGIRSLSFLIFIEYILGLFWLISFLLFFASKFQFLKVLLTSI